MVPLYDRDGLPCSRKLKSLADVLLPCPRKLKSLADVLLEVECA